MDSKKIDELLSSAYDGIQEYDNDLPRWWVQLFVLTVIVGLAYAAYVHLLGAPSDEEKLNASMKELEQVRLAYQAANSHKTSGIDLLEKLAVQPDHIEKGKQGFTARCAACHGQKGEGLVGPNLTDEFWLHGGTLTDIQKTIVEGVPDKGMMAWKSLMSQDDINDLVAYLWSIRNTNVPGKAPQGEKQ